MNKLVFTLSVVIVFVIIKCYYKSFYDINKSFNIIQTPLTKLNYNLLFEKSPIIINEPIYDPYDMIEKVFRYLYIKQSIKSKIKSTVNNKYVITMNNSRYALITCKVRDIILNIYHPMFPKKFMPVKLYKDQCIILPNLWSYQSTDCKDILIIELYDIPILVKNYIFKK